MKAAVDTPDAVAVDTPDAVAIDVPHATSFAIMPISKPYERLMKEIQNSMMGAGVKSPMDLALQLSFILKVYKVGGDNSIFPTSKQL